MRVSLKHQDIVPEAYTTKRLRADFADTNPISAFSADLFARTVKAIRFDEDEVEFKEKIKVAFVGGLEVEKPPPNINTQKIFGESSDPYPERRRYLSYRPQTAA